MSTRSFHARAIEWLRNRQDLRTEVRPGEWVEPEASGGARVHGHFARPSTASGWAYAGLCALTLGAVLTMFNMPGFSPQARSAVWRAGYGAHAAAVGCFVTAEVKRRRNRTRAVIELRAASSSPPTPESVVALCEEVQGAAVWIVAEQDLSADVLRSAKERGVRCFVAGAAGFDESDVPPPTPGEGEGIA